MQELLDHIRRQFEAAGWPIEGVSVVEVPTPRRPAKRPAPVREPLALLQLMDATRD